MKVAIYSLVAAVVVGVVLYLYSDSKKQVMPGISFEADDQYLYDYLRSDLKKYLPQIGTYYAGWNDDEVMENYNAGAPSKSAAFVAMAIKYYPEKATYYNFLLDNLSNRYQ